MEAVESRGGQVVGGKERWEGGYIRRTKAGRPIFIIEREVAGRRFHVSTRASTHRAALLQLQRFEGDPAHYQPSGVVGGVVAEGEPIYLTADLASEFIGYSAAKGNSDGWQRTQAFYIEKWIEDLSGVDLRRATLRDHIRPALDRRKTGEPGRIIVIKALYGWLRKVRHQLVSSEDCTLDLPVPQGRPEKWRRQKAVSLDDVRAMATHLDGAYLDVLTLMGGTGWHCTEIERFVRSPNSRVVKTKRGDTIAVLVTKHKGGEPTRTPVKSPKVLGAAERLRARGKMPRRLNDAFKAACRTAGVPEFTAGVMRHTVGTWAVEEGADPAQVSQFLGHKDPRTTKRFYIDVAVPTTSVKLPELD